MEDVRGAEYLDQLGRVLDPERLYTVNGNTLGNHYGLTKLMWRRDQRSDEYAKTHKYLLWSGFVSFMLGAEAAVDFSLANRTLLFDIRRTAWSEEILAAVGLDASKLPDPVPSGAVIGRLAPHVADDLGLPAGALIAAGAHDQCANALGCGATREGRAMLGMGTYHCIVPVFAKSPAPDAMMARGLNTEHHAAPGLFVSFIYNQGGGLFKWYRDTFARAEHATALAGGRDIYADLLAEMPEAPSRVMALPHFAATGPPNFITDSSGVLAGLHLDTTRGEIAKAILEGAAFYLRECVDALPGVGISVDSFRTVGGGSKSDRWVRLCADVFGVPCVRPEQTEAGALGAAILAGVGAGVFQTHAEGAEAVVRLERAFEPHAGRNAAYDARFKLYQAMWPSMKEYLQALSAAETQSTLT
jgi:xylulokinase